MSKKILAFVLFSIIIVSGCSPDYELKDYEFKLQDQDYEQADELELSPPIRIHPSLGAAAGMVIANVDEGQNQVIVTIFNDSEYELITGLPFTVEIFDGEYWRNIPWRDKYIAFVDLGYSIHPNDSIAFMKDLNLFIPLEPGRYRIRKDVFRNIDTPIRDADLHDVVAEFSLGG